MTYSCTHCGTKTNQPIECVTRANVVLFKGVLCRSCWETISRSIDVDLCGKPQPTLKKMRMYSDRYKSTEKE